MEEEQNDNPLTFSVLFSVVVLVALFIVVCSDESAFTVVVVSFVPRLLGRLISIRCVQEMVFKKVFLIKKLCNLPVSVEVCDSTILPAVFLPCFSFFIYSPGFYLHFFFQFAPTPLHIAK